jgi:hypothetical protein
VRVRVYLVVLGKTPAGAPGCTAGLETAPADFEQTPTGSHKGVASARAWAGAGQWEPSLGAVPASQARDLRRPGPMQRMVFPRSPSYARTFGSADVRRKPPPPSPSPRARPARNPPESPITWCFRPFPWADSVDTYVCSSMG